MTVSLDFIVALTGMALAAFACRAGGFVLMRFVPSSPRLEAALRAIPLAVMVGIVAPAIAGGRLAEIAGIAAIAALMRLTGSEFAAALGGVAVVALTRLAQG